jgi:antiviral helicase SLH1
LPDLNVSVSNITAVGFTVNISRTKPLESKEGRMYAPQFPKPQTEGFFLVVSKSGSDELVALKRINWPSSGGGRQAGRGRLSTNTTVHIPQDGESRTLDVSVLSDGYIGMEWAVEKVEIPHAPVVVDDGGKKH